jgi:hypothetical protein
MIQNKSKYEIFSIKKNAVQPTALIVSFVLERIAEDVACPSNGIGH